MQFPADIIDQMSSQKQVADFRNLESDTEKTDESTGDQSAEDTVFIVVMMVNQDNEVVDDNFKGYSVSSVTSTEIKLQLEFDDPLEVS